jgi:hypothetical protein
MRPPYPVNLPDRKSHAYSVWAYFIRLLSSITEVRADQVSGHHETEPN